MPSWKSVTQTGPTSRGTTEFVENLKPLIDRALAGDSVIVLPQDRTAEIAEVAPSLVDSERPPALILFTSGSTGPAKAVGLSPEALLASARATEEHLGGPGDWYLCLPVNHISGFQVELRAHLAGRAPVRSTSRSFTSASFARDAEVLLGRTRSTGRRAFTSLVPTQLHRILEGGDRAIALAGEFDAILLGGSAVSPALTERAERAGLRLVRTYGMSETAGGCVYDGRAFDGVTLSIEASGTISITGPVVADSYLERTDSCGFRTVDSPALTRNAHGDRTIHTSDLGRLDDGILTVLGRSDDIIVSGGENVSPHALEAGLLPVWQKHGIAEALVTWVPDVEWGKRIVVLVRTDTSAGVDLPTDPNVLAERLNNLGEVKDALPGQLLPRQALIVSEIPQRSIGKPDRRAAAELAAEITSQARVSVRWDGSV